MKAVWPEIKRGIGQTRSASEVADVDGPGVWLWIECKVGKLHNIRAAVRQALEATDGRPVVALVQDDGSGARPPALWACMKFDEWLPLIKEIQDLRTEVRVLREGQDNDRAVSEARDSLHPVEENPDLGEEPQDTR